MDSRVWPRKTGSRATPARREIPMFQDASAERLRIGWRPKDRLVNLLQIAITRGSRLPASGWAGAEPLPPLTGGRRGLRATKVCKRAVSAAESIRRRTGTILRSAQMSHEWQGRLRPGFLGRLGCALIAGRWVEQPDVRYRHWSRVFGGQCRPLRFKP